VNALFVADKLGMCCLIRGFEVVVIALGKNFVLQQKLGAVELTVGTGHLDFRFIVVGSRGGYFAALDEAYVLSLGHVLTGPNIQFDQATGDLRVDMDHSGGVRLNPGGEHQAIRDWLGMDGSDFDGRLSDGSIDGFGRLVMAAETGQEGQGG
jgi:hypothetical protein